MAIENVAKTVRHFYVATFRQYIPFYCRKGARRDKSPKLYTIIGSTHYCTWPIRWVIAFITNKWLNFWMDNVRLDHYV